MGKDRNGSIPERLMKRIGVIGRGGRQDVNLRKGKKIEVLVIFNIIITILSFFIGIASLIVGIIGIVKNNSNGGYA